MATTLPRIACRAAVEQALDDAPIIALLGPRQCGKTTLAREFLSSSSHYFDLEDPALAALMEQPMSTLQSLRGLVIIDEAQRRPELFPILRVLADRADAPRLTRSMRTAFTDLALHRLLVIYPGSRAYPITEHIHALPLGLIHDPEQRAYLG